MSGFVGGCTLNHTTGCKFNAAKGASGCPSGVCCKEETECNQQINAYLEKIVAYKLKLRLLKDEFRKRPKSSCDEFKPISKTKYEADKKKIEGKIDEATKKIVSLKRGKKAALLIKGEPKSFCADVTTGCGCK